MISNLAFQVTLFPVILCPGNTQFLCFILPDFSMSVLSANGGMSDFMKYCILDSFYVIFQHKSDTQSYCLT